MTAKMGVDMESRRSAIVADFLERAAWTAGQQFFAVLLTTTAATVGHLPWKVALATAAGAAIVSLASTGLQRLAKLTDLSFWPDLVVRVGKTFLAAFLGTVGADAFNVLTFGWKEAVNVAAVAAIVALGKGILARNEPEDEDAAGSAKQAVNPSTLSTGTYRLACAK